jgi:hypothetical protein
VALQPLPQSGDAVSQQAPPFDTRALIESDIHRAINCAPSPSGGVGRRHPWKVQCPMVQRPDSQPEQAAKKAAVIGLELFLASAILIAAVAFLVVV